MKKNLFPKNEFSFWKNSPIRGRSVRAIKRSALPEKPLPISKSYSKMYPVVLGVRPENVHATLGDRKVSTTYGVDARISNGENMGPDLIVFYEYHYT